MSYQHAQVKQLFTGAIGITPVEIYTVPADQQAIVGSFIVHVNPDAGATVTFELWLVKVGDAGVDDSNRVMRRVRTVDTDVELISKPWVLEEGQSLYAKSSIEGGATLVVSGSTVVNVV
jgi:hypothetical protein